MSTRLLKIIAGYLALAVLFTPLLSFPSYFVFPFIVPKALWLRSLTIILAALTFLIWYFERRQTGGSAGKLSIVQRVKNYGPLVGSVIFLAIGLTVSTIVGVDWQRSFFDTHERMLGVFTIFHYLLLFFVFSYLFKTWADWRRVLLVFLGVATVAVVVGLIQKINPNFLYNRGAGEVISTLGNPLYFAGLGVFAFFIGALLFTREKTWWRYFSAAAAILGVVAVFISGARAGLLGLAGGVVVAALVLAFFNDDKKYRRLALMVIAGLIVLGGLVVIGRDSAVVKNISVLNDVTHLSWEGTSIKTRLLAWKVGYLGWTDRPLLGWGPNNYYYVFNKFYNPEFLNFGFHETWFDNAHNEIFNTLATGGVVGLLAYLGLFAAAVYELLKIRRTGTDGIWLAALGGGFLAAHFIYNLFVFENLTSYLYFFVFLAFVRALSRPDEAVLANTEKRVTKNWLLLTLGAALAIVFISNVNVAFANHYSYMSRGEIVYSGNINSGTNYYERAQIWRSPYQAEIGWDYATDILRVLPDLYTANSSTARGRYDLAEAGIKRFVTEHPQDVRARLMYTDILRAGIVLFDLPLKEAIDEQFSTAQRLSPGRQQVDYSKLTFEAGTGDIKAAIAEMRVLVEKYPAVAEGYYHLARFYFYDNAMLEILPVLDLAVNRGVGFTDPEHLEFVAKAYEREGRFRDALYWWDQLYNTTGADSVKNRRDRLSQLTQKSVPKSLEEFFKFTTGSIKN